MGRTVCVKYPGSSLHHLAIPGRSGCLATDDLEKYPCLADARNNPSFLTDDISSGLDIVPYQGIGGYVSKPDVFREKASKNALDC